VPVIDLKANTKLADLVRAQALARGEQTALINEGAALSFAELDRRSNQVARQLLAAGFRPGDRVAILAKNGIPFYELLFGAAKARAAVAPLNFRLAAPEIAYALRDCGAKIFLVGRDFLDLAARALADAEMAGAPKPALFALDEPHADWGFYPAWREAGLAQDPHLVADAMDDVVQLYTSGTTGRPKGVQITNLNYNAFLSLSRGVTGFDYGPGERVLNAMPLFHVAGANVGVAAIAGGATTVILTDLVPAAALALIARHRINHAFFVPAVILMLMNAPEIRTADLSSLRSIAYGASPIAEDLLVRAQRRFCCGFLQLYGMTETTGAGTFLPPEAHDPARGKLRSCGIPWPGIEVRIVDEAGAACAPGAVGEVTIRAPIVMKGYWNRPDATQEAVQDGWMRTGDAAYRDEEGYIFIYDRVKDMIVTGGENVYPAEVENAIFGHPQVADVAVFGVPDEKWGEAVKAVVIAKPGETVDPASVIAYARERIANYKVPKSVDVVTAIPRNASGKILRRELREPYWEGRERRVS
jgi:acyl-CoA synthetase (AMP-forming)/AMP-acid ligase II